MTPVKIQKQSSQPICLGTVERSFLRDLPFTSDRSLYTITLDNKPTTIPWMSPRGLIKRSHCVVSGSGSVFRISMPQKTTHPKTTRIKNSHCIVFRFFTAAPRIEHSLFFRDSHRIQQVHRGEYTCQSRRAIKAEAGRCSAPTGQ